MGDHPTCSDLPSLKDLEGLISRQPFGVAQLTRVLDHIWGLSTLQRFASSLRAFFHTPYQIKTFFSNCLWATILPAQTFQVFQTWKVSSHDNLSELLNSQEFLIISGGYPRCKDLLPPYEPPSIPPYPNRNFFFELPTGDHPTCSDLPSLKDLEGLAHRPTRLFFNHPFTRHFPVNILVVPKHEFLLAAKPAQYFIPAQPSRITRQHGGKRTVHPILEIIAKAV